MKKIDYKAKLDKWEKKLSLLNEIKLKLPKEIISINLESTETMFNPFDSSDYLTKELNEDLNDYLFSSVDKIDVLPNLTVNVNIQNNEKKFSEEDLSKIFKNHFEQKSINQFISNQKQAKKWTRYFFLGLIFLGLCLLASRILLMPFFEDKAAFTVIRESLSIIGCVALWEPSGYFFFGRKENKRILRNYMILHQANFNFINSIPSSD